MVISSLLVSYSMTAIIDCIFDIGYSPPLTCWLIENHDTTGDELIMCYMVVLIPIMLWNWWQVKQSTDEGLMEQVIKPYIERMNIYIIISIMSVLFEIVTSFLGSVGIFPHMRNSRYMRYLNLLISLGSLLC